MLLQRCFQLPTQPLTTEEDQCFSKAKVVVRTKCSMIKIRNEDDGDRELQLLHCQDSGAHTYVLNLVLKGDQCKASGVERKTCIELFFSGPNHR